MIAARLLIVHWNQPQACAATVQALLAQKVVLHTTVIDNHSEPAAYAELQNSLDRWVEIVRLEENRGWGGALNILLRRWLSEESEPYCLISAHDAMPEAGCLRLLIDALDADSRIGIGCPQYAEPYVVRLSSRRGIFPETVAPQEVGTVQEVDAPHGTLMIVRRECLAEIGLFDERYFAYGDEHDLGVRAARRGWKVVMVWGAVVTNPGTWTASALRSYLFARNSLLLVREYFGGRAAWLRAVLLLGNTLRLSAFSRGKDFSARARFRAVRDYFLGRHGKPDLG
ncbi:MAG TPA: glycosyltransferase [Chthoniobacterales bacterium]|nr:glycosyltransferase [Chthoniobacterales bacterium]